MPCLCGAAEPGGASPRAVVAAAKVTRGELSQQASFEAELRPWQEIELHARITGYLDTLKVDAGDLVKENQLIATLEQPEMKIGNRSCARQRAPQQGGN